MKAIRVMALGFALLVGATAVASAQGAGNAQQQGRGRGDTQLNGIELTDAQKAKLDEIRKKYQPEMAAIREQLQAGGDRAELMKKIGALRDKQGAEVRAILTAEQQVVFDKNMAELKARMEQRQAPPTI